jgi:hypothetical protein
MIEDGDEWEAHKRTRAHRRRAAKLEREQLWGAGRGEKEKEKEEGGDSGATLVESAEDGSGSEGDERIAGMQGLFGETDELRKSSTQEQ